MKDFQAEWEKVMDAIVLRSNGSIEVPDPERPWSDRFQFKGGEWLDSEPILKAAAQRLDEIVQLSRSLRTSLGEEAVAQEAARLLIDSLPSGATSEGPTLSICSCDEEGKTCPGEYCCPEGTPYRCHGECEGSDRNSHPVFVDANGVVWGDAWTHEPREYVRAWKNTREWIGGYGDPVRGVHVEWVTQAFMLKIGHEDRAGTHSPKEGVRQEDGLWRIKSQPETPLAQLLRRYKWIIELLETTAK